jgi:hypothetical protein
MACKNETPILSSSEVEIAPSDTRTPTASEASKSVIMEAETPSSDGMDTITVSTVEDLVKNAKSNRVMYLSKGTYELEKNLVYYMTKEEQKIIDKNVVDTRSIGGQLFFYGIENFQLIGQKGAQIVSKNPEAVSFFVVLGRNWKISNLTIKKPEGGIADLSYFSNCQDVEVDRCHFDGGGTYGMYVTNVENMKVINSKITRCTSGAVRINNSRGISFVQSTFSNNICKVPLVNFYGTTSTATFNDVTIADNKKDPASNFENSDRIFAAGSNIVTLNNCVIQNNEGFKFLGLLSGNVEKSRIEGLEIQQ